MRDSNPFPSAFRPGISPKHFVIVFSAFSANFLGKEKRVRGHLALRQGIPLLPFLQLVS
jgi:hypothetical protein